jgi:hypothetical protein
MAHESHLYDESDTKLYKTDGYGGSNADLDSTERFTGDIDLTVNIGAALDFRFDGSGSTDDLILYLYKRRNSIWDGSETALWSITIANDGSESCYHFTIDESYGAGHFRFGMKSSGSTDTFEMDVEMRQWRSTDTIA